MIEGVKVPVKMTSPKVGLALPLRVVVPENVTTLAVKVGEELLTTLPFKLTALALELNEPVKVSVPLTVTSAPSVTEPLPIMRLLSTVVEAGSSFPVVILEPV